MKKIKIILITILLIVALPILFISSVILADSIFHPEEIPSFFGWKPFIVLTSSMEEEIMAGDVAVVKEVPISTIKKGDVIAFKFDDEVVVTHRIIKKGHDEKGSYYLTKGDNNSKEDDWKVYEEELEGVYQFKINKLGYIAMFLQSTTGMLICMTIPIGLLFIIQVIENFKDRKNAEQTEEELLEKIEELEKENEALLQKKKRYNSRK